MATPMALSHDSPANWRVNGDHPGDMHARRAFPGSPDKVSGARHLVAHLLDGCPQLEEMVLVANELICNAIRHTRSGRVGGVFVLDVCRKGDVVEIAVIDQGGTAQAPQVRTLEQSLDELTFHGRGLLTVAGLASHWGWQGDQAGRCVWAEFRPCGSAPRPSVVPQVFGLDGAGVPPAARTGSDVF